MEAQTSAHVEVLTPAELARFDAMFEQTVYYSHEIDERMARIRKATEMNAPPTPLLVTLVWLMDVIALEELRAASMEVSIPSWTEILTKHGLITPDTVAVRRLKQIRGRTQ